ncbi:MAG: cytochrome P450 [Streptosporangiales bacterium]|nr:cytochrome P450 [Streptosporangiales bacterium]
MSHTMIAVDPPDYTRLRKLVVRGFSATRVEALRPRVQEIADELLDAAASRDDVDLLEALAFPLPVRVIADVLGVPSDIRDRLIAEAGAASMVPMDAVATEMTALIEAGRATPTDDLLTELVAAHGDHQLTDVELVQMAGILFAAGHVTTVHLILGGVRTLPRHPAQLAELRRDPALVPHAFDELLRHVGPVPAISRYALDDVAIGGVTIPRGSHVTVALTTANHDPAAFTDPDTFDIHRNGTQDVAFGHGIHFCLGARLAKLEAEVAIDTLLCRFPELALADEPNGVESMLDAAQPLLVHLRRRP